MISKVCVTTLKIHNQTPEVAMSLNKKRVLSQILSFLGSKMMEAEPNETLSTDSNFGNILFLSI